MVNAVNNCLVFSLQQEDCAPISLDIPVVKRIFADVIAGSPQDFKNCTLVCRNWRQMIVDALYAQVVPHLFGKADYLQFIGGDSGPELPIPLEYLVKFRPGETLLAFSPKEVAFTQADGTVVVEPRTMVNIGKWALNAKGANHIGYHPNTLQQVIDEERPFEDSHWTFIDIRRIEKSKVFAEQERAVLERREAIADLRDLSLSLLMTYVKTGVKHLNCGETDTNYQWVRVPETIQGWTLCVGFATAGLFVDIHLDIALSSIGVVVGRKSFGHELKNGS